jgi:hypothetical protein
VQLYFDYQVLILQQNYNLMILDDDYLVKMLIFISGDQM